MTTSAQLQQHQEANEFRYRSALDVLLAAEKAACQLTDEITAALVEHTEKGGRLKAEAARLREERGQTSAAEPNTAGKGKERAASEFSSPYDDDDEQDLPRNLAGEEHSSKMLALQLRLREARISLHKVYFLKGDVYHVLGDVYTDAENESYAKAEELRRLLLKGEYTQLWLNISC